MTAELQTTAQALIQILTLNKNTGTALEKLLKLPLLDAENKIPAEALRIVGALSAGYIIESGDNANGNYIRFANGTQICWTTALTAQTGESGESANYATADWTFPSEFIEIACVFGVFQVLIGGRAHTLYRSKATETDATLFFNCSSQEYVTGTALAGAIAIGKWK